MQYSANQAANATGKNVATITRAIKSGRISAQKDTSGAWQIDGAELSRVFPLKAQSLQTTTAQMHEGPLQRQKTDDHSALREELVALRERVKAKDTLLEDRANQIADLQKRLDKAEDRLALADQRPKVNEPALIKQRSWWRFS